MAPSARVARAARPCAAVHMAAWRCGLLSLLLAPAADAAQYPTVWPEGQPGEEAYLPKRWKGSGLSTDYHLSGFSDQSKVVELTAATFNETVAKHEGALVAFCMKDTGQTDGLLIEFGKLGIEHHNGTGRILMSKVDAVKERELAERHGVVHYPTIWWYVDGKPAREYPEDASRFDKDLTDFMARQLAPVAPAIPEGAEVAWAKAALQSIELNVLGHFESDDAPLLRALRRAVLLREHVSASYTADAAAYARTAQALQVDVGTERPLLLVKPYDERVVQLPTAELSALPFDEMVAGVGALLQQHGLPLLCPFHEAYQRHILERAASLPILFVVGLPTAIPTGPLTALASKYRGRLLVVTVSPRRHETALLRGWLGLDPAVSADTADTRFFGYRLNGGIDQRLYALSGEVGQPVPVGSFIEAILDGSAPSVPATLPNPTGPNLELQDVTPLPRPRRTLRECHVHKCAEGEFIPEHTVRMGEHGEEMVESDVHLSGNITSANFYYDYLASNVPVVLRGEAAASIRNVEWDDAFFLDRCQLPGGKDWRTLVELNKVVIRNDRHPLMEDFNMCKFIQSYALPEFSDKLYAITPLNLNDNLLRDALGVPPAMRCADLFETVRESRLWMSSGNTSSSLHFDTHDNLLMQIDGEKTVLLWPPSESVKFYMDYHDRWGLSPLSVDRVDLLQFPLFAHAKHGVVAHVKKGDVVLIPGAQDGWWHQIRSHGRNVAVTLEIEPHEELHGLWSSSADWYKHKDEATAWWERTMLKRYHTVGLSVASPLECKQLVPEESSATAYMCDHPGQPCNFECMPGTCRVEALRKVAVPMPSIFART